MQIEAGFQPRQATAQIPHLGPKDAEGDSDREKLRGENDAEFKVAHHGPQIPAGFSGKN